MIRYADFSDSAQIAAISTRELGYPCQADFVKDRLMELIPGREAVFVYELDGKAVGYVHVEQYRTLYFAPMANILGIAVAAQYQRQGIGKKLLRAAEIWAAEQGIGYMRLNSGITRKEAHAFYRTMGYSDEKEQLRFLKKLSSD